MSQSSPELPNNVPARDLNLSLPLEVFDVFVRAAVEIKAELGADDAPAVEDLIAFWLGLPQADDLIRDFIRGDLYSLETQTRDMVLRDLGRLELEPPHILPTSSGGTRLGKQLDAERRVLAAERAAQGQATKLEAFVHDNPAIVNQVAGCSHEVLSMWVLLYLMHATEARARGNRAASRYLDRNPEMRARLQAVAHHSLAIKTTTNAVPDGPKLA